MHSHRGTRTFFLLITSEHRRFYPTTVASLFWYQSSRWSRTTSAASLCRGFQTPYSESLGVASCPVSCRFCTPRNLTYPTVSFCHAAVKPPVNHTIPVCAAFAFSCPRRVLQRGACLQTYHYMGLTRSPTSGYRRSSEIESKFTVAGDHTRDI